MPAYRFEALDAARQGHAPACSRPTTPRAARAQLRAQALVPLAVTPGRVSAGTGAGRRLRLGAPRLQRDRPGGLDAPARRPGRLGPAARARAHRARPTRPRTTRQRELVAHLRSEVNAGSPFARALAQRPREFDDVYRGVVAAGEQSGALGLVLERLADDLEERQELQGQADRRDALPGHRLGDRHRHRASSSSPTSCRRWPRVRQHQAGAAVPDRGDAGASAPSCAAGAGCSLLAPSPAASALLRWRCATRRSASASTPAGSSLPLVGRLARGYNAARFAGTLAMLAGAGVPILKALQAAAETLSQPRDARRRAGCAGAGARRRAAGLGAGRQEALSRACWRCSRGSASRPASCR